MRDRPILFSAPLIPPILADRKTRTRRPVKPQPQPNGGVGFAPVKPYMRPDGGWAWTLAETGMGVSDPFRCPYGLPGDRLWVREGIRLIERREPLVGLDRDTAVYIADGELTPLDTWCWQRTALPAIHMPRGLCRIELEVLSVRVERLHAITPEEVIAEGIDPAPHRCGCEVCSTTSILCTASASSLVLEFADRWRQIYGAESWAANPWVWNVEFRRISAAAA